jgi:hypothetical protein
VISTRPLANMPVFTGTLRVSAQRVLIGQPDNDIDREDTFVIAGRHGADSLYRAVDDFPVRPATGSLTSGPMPSRRSRRRSPRPPSVPSSFR